MPNASELFRHVTSLQPGQSCTSLAGFNTSDEVRCGFEFGPNGPAFYPVVNIFGEHKKRVETPGAS